MAAASDDRLPSVSEAVERVGFGHAQLLAGFLGGGVYLVSGATLLLAGALSEPIGHAWHLRAWERAALMSAIFIGMLVGNSSSGPLGDSLGRKGVIVACYACVLLAGLLCVFAQSFGMLCVWRVFLGAALGLGVPPWMVLSTEITPTKWRVAGNAYSQSLFVVGEIYSALIILWVDSSMRHLEWRSLTAVGVCPALALGGLAWMFLVQSPTYLAAKGEHAQAREVLVSMARQNGAPAVSSAFRQDAAPIDAGGSSADAQYQALFGRRMLFSTVTMLAACFVLNLVFYGVLYGLPQVVENVDTGVQPAVSVVMGAVWEFPGLLAGALFGTWFRRLPVIVGCYAGMASALMLFALGVSLNHAWFAGYLIQFSVMLIKMLCNTCFVVVYQYTSEIYPSIARTTGSALCVSGGRLGAILAPVFFETLAEYTGTFSSFFMVASATSTVVSFMALFLPFETAGKNLDAETEPILGKDSAAARKLCMA